MSLWTKINPHTSGVWSCTHESSLPWLLQCSSLLIELRIMLSPLCRIYSIHLLKPLELVWYHFLFSGLKTNSTLCTQTRTRVHTVVYFVAARSTLSFWSPDHSDLALRVLLWPTIYKTINVSMRMYVCMYVCMRSLLVNEQCVCVNDHSPFSFCPVLWTISYLHQMQSLCPVAQSSQPYFDYSLLLKVKWSKQQSHWETEVMWILCLYQMLPVYSVNC